MALKQIILGDKLRKARERLEQAQHKAEEARSQRTELGLVQRGLLHEGARRPGQELPPVERSAEVGEHEARHVVGRGAERARRGLPDRLERQGLGVGGGVPEGDPVCQVGA